MRNGLCSLLVMAACGLPVSYVCAGEARKGLPQPPSPGMMFERMDRNHDGSVSEDEAPPFMKEHWARILEKADKNKDKKLDKAEMAEAGKQMIERMRGGPFGQSDPAVFFKHVDKNQDGFITEDEAPPPMKDRWAQILEKADKNKDKKLDKAELAESAKQMIQRMRGGPAGQSGKPAAPRPSAAKPSAAKPGDAGSHKRPGPWVERDGKDWPRGPGFAWGSPWGRGFGPSPFGFGPGHGRTGFGHWGPGAWGKGPACPCGCPMCGAGRGSQGGPGWFGSFRSWLGHRPGGDAKPAHPMARLWGMFQRMDRDNDGKLSFREFAAGMTFLGHLRGAGMRGPGVPPGAVFKHRHDAKPPCSDAATCPLAKDGAPKAEGKKAEKGERREHRKELKGDHRPREKAKPADKPTAPKTADKK